jgi:precorrin-6A/cobalt-precorrin-6A reductase
MGSARTILLLAGSAEARALARALVAAGWQLRTLVSEPPRGPAPMPVPFDLVSFADPAALRPYLAGVAAVLDASHGFDGRMTSVGVHLAQEAGLPFLSLRRPAWPLAGHPLRLSAPDVASAMALIGPGERVFAATGWESLPALASFPGERLFLRQTSRHDRRPPHDFVTLSFGDPPFDVAREKALFRELRIDRLLARNLGGGPSLPKLTAAEELGLGTILIDRPPLPEGVESRAEVSEALDWVARL